ncbi:Glucose-dependent insulinotropic receptor G-protein coupled receptor 119 [Larimichthys crocea]|uniref:Glucose-dependent insulinotropic receptor G-protein coupled receptor 119 n=1 Tax=Larimichthys crocea TaxID=215358 RepID=A0A6G0I8X2_LARCR|nr:Glucose-dependent insulinotropic receptor G-protein coupled receptor 119 [Larimichthys crocea]
MSFFCGHASTEPSVSMTPDCMDSYKATTQSDVRPRVMGVILSIAACLIISTNLLVAAALVKLLLKKSSQSWCFVLNLALADALVGVAITGLATEDFNGISKNVTQNQYNHIPPDPLTNTTTSAQGKTRCLIRMAFVTSPCTASIMSMFLISLDRYAAIKMPLRYTQLSGKGTALVSLLALWISSLTLGFLPVMVRQLQTDHYDGFCAFFSVIQQVGMIVLFSACFFPVLSVFIYIYLDILKIACSHQKQICQVRQAGSRTADHHGHQQHEQNHQHQQLRSYWSHVKALRTVAVLVGCFLALWCPFFVTCIVQLLCKSCKLTDVLENYLWLLGLSNSLINPLVYAFWQKEVRLQLAAMFSCKPLVGGPPGVTERCDPLPVLTQASAPTGDTLNPSLLLPIIDNDKVVPLSATTNL